MMAINSIMAIVLAGEYGLAADDEMHVDFEALVRRGLARYAAAPGTRYGYRYVATPLAVDLVTRMREEAARSAESLLDSETA